MSTTYVFTTSKGRFIINDEVSTIGYHYPRIFVERADKEEYVNIDATLGAAFKQTKEAFESWLDGTENAETELQAVCELLGISYNNLRFMIADIQGCNTDEIK